MHVFFDESGNTGSDLLNKEQPLFALASTCLEEGVAQRLIGPLKRQGQKEAKYSKLKNSVSGQKALIEFLSCPELSLSTAKFTQADKRYYLITHLVDKLIEPTLYENGRDLYAKDGHVGLVNVWYYAGATIFPNGHWERVLSAFEHSVRCPTSRAFSEFDTTLLRACSLTPHDCRDFATGLLMAKGRLEEFIGCYRGGVVFDPAPDLFTAMIHKWMDDYPGKFAITHDKSKPLARNEAFFRALIVDAPTRFIGYGDHQVEMPLRVNDFSFADSRDFAQLQIADIIAGACTDALLAWSGRKPMTSYHEALKETNLESLFVGGMLPTPSMPTVRAPAPGEVSLVDGSAAFLRETGYAR
ncbi:DUF3800 domain-containing protein [Duganella callida]|uniref:DUF3800 domain-containing protein n=1 Tax=Duganella callida TaxID=2561932 RepID=A0A4Y9SFB9_9BURK|nr:DUF3800 domain-containing protein [Duganella callida]TFW18661.1 DUF3800 domain-containing protein [Duganella callida]